MSDQATNTPAASPPNSDQLETIWRECEAKLKITREDVQRVLGNSTNGQPLSLDDQNRLRQMLDLLSSQATDPFGLLNRAISDAQRAPEKNNQPITPNPTSTNATPPTPTNSIPNSPQAEDDAVDFSTAPSPGSLAEGDPVAQPDPPGTGGEAPPFAAGVAPAPVGTASPDDGSTPFDGFDASTLARVQAAQSAGERLQAAFEQSAEATASLFEQMLALADGQNQKLAGIERKLSELTGQLNSLKNP